MDRFSRFIQESSCPFLYPTTALSIGILIQHFYSYGLIISILSVCTLVWHYYYAHRIHPLIILSFSMLGAGPLLYQYQRHRFETYQRIQGRMTLTGTVVQSTSMEKPLWKQQTLIYIDDPQSPLYGTYITCFSKITPLFSAGSTVTIANASLQNSGVNRYHDYLIKQGIVGSIYTSTKNITILKQKTWYGRIIHYKDQILMGASHNLSRQTAALFESVFLGNKKKHPPEQLEFSLLFKPWGIIHFIARSGLHVSLFVYIIQFLLTYLPVWWAIKQVLLIFVVAMYALLSWSSISFMRAIMLFIFMKLYQTAKIPYHFLTILCFIWIFTISLNPIALFFLDFQLSFILTAALSWYSIQNYKHSPLKRG